MRTVGLGSLLACAILLLGPMPGLAAEDDATKTNDLKTGELKTGDLKTRIAAWKAEIQTARKAKDADGLVEATARGLTLHGEAQGDRVSQKAIVDTLGALPKASKDERVAEAALLALGETGDPRAGRHIRLFLRQRDAEKTSLTLRAAIHAASAAPSSALVKPLLTLATRSGHAEVIRDATRALANYGEIQGRERIVRTLLASLKKCMPADDEKVLSVRPQDVVDARRWTTLCGQVPGVLNKLTGRRASSVDAWFVLYDEYKTKLDKLFVGEE